VKEFAPVRGNRTIGRQDIVEKVNMAGAASPFDASEHAVAHHCLHGRQSFQLCDWCSQVLQRMEQREAFEDLHDRGKRVEAEEDIEMDRVFPWTR
jgi:hypothetical protein